METRRADHSRESAWNRAFPLCSERVGLPVVAAEWRLWETRGCAGGGGVFQALRKDAGGRVGAAFRSAADSATEAFSGSSFHFLTTRFPEAPYNYHCEDDVLIRRLQVSGLLSFGPNGLALPLQSVNVL